MTVLNGIMSLNRDSCIQIGCMPAHKNTIDCGVFVCRGLSFPTTIHE